MKFHSSVIMQEKAFSQLLLKNNFRLYFILCLFCSQNAIADPIPKDVEFQHLATNTGSLSEDSTLKITMPTPRIVYQRNNGKAVIPVQGRCATEATLIEARLVSREPGQGTTTKWVTIDAAPVQGIFSG